jgi:hypothetical protein
MYIYCAYPAMSKSQIHLPNWLKITETSFVLIVFNCVISDVNVYDETISYCCSTSSVTSTCMMKPFLTVALRHLWRQRVWWNHFLLLLYVICDVNVYEETISFCCSTSSVTSTCMMKPFLTVALRHLWRQRVW